jgi:hypothetical protein
MWYLHIPFGWDTALHAGMSGQNYGFAPSYTKGVTAWKAV